MLWAVPRSKHTVPTVVVNNGSVGGYNPWTSGGEGDIRVDRSWIVKIHETVLKFGDERGFVSIKVKFGKLVGHGLEPRIGLTDGR